MHLTGYRDFKCNLKTLMLSCMVVVSVLTCRTCIAQNVDDFGAWFSINTQGKMPWRPEESKLRWWFDGHLRYFDDTNGFGQSIFRPGLGYQLNQDTQVWLGYAWINTMPPVTGASLVNENRFWQQLIWSKKVGRQTLLSRSRLEQRFVETGSDTGWRFRQFLKSDRPFHEESPFSFVIWDEAFFALNSTDWGQQGTFGQNRLFLGLGFKMNGPNKPKFEIGYLNQFIRRRAADDRFSHLVSANWFCTF